MQQYFEKLDVLRLRYLERDDFVRGLVGKPILWRGFVGAVTRRAPDPVHVFVRVGKDERELRGTLVTFEPSWETKLYSLREGDLVQIEGKYEGETPTMPSIRGVNLILVQTWQK
jgi:hypothetical protein